MLAETFFGIPNISYILKKILWDIEKNVQCVDRIFCRCPLSLSNMQGYLIHIFLFSFCWEDLSIGESRELKFPMTIKLELLCDFTPNSICFNCAHVCLEYIYLEP